MLYNGLYIIFTTGKVLEDLLDARNTSESDGEGNGEQTNCQKTFIPEVESNICVLFEAAIILKTLIKAGPDFDSPWPPTSYEINLENARKMIPIGLFSMDVRND